MQGVGKVVSYTNADRILPRELLDAIQQYADGVYLYIPRKAERKRAWGEATDSRRERLARNRELYEKHLGRSRAQTGGRILPLRQDHL